MITSSLQSSPMSSAFLRVPAPIGALCPAWDVEKKTGSRPARSFSSCMRCIRTEPTIPRQPTIPTFIFLFPCIWIWLLLLIFTPRTTRHAVHLQVGDNGIAHSHSIDLFLTLEILENITRTAALIKSLLNGCIDSICSVDHAERVA